MLKKVRTKNKKNNNKKEGKHQFTVQKVKFISFDGKDQHHEMLNFSSISIFYNICRNKKRLNCFNSYYFAKIYSISCTKQSQG